MGDDCNSSIGSTTDLEEIKQKMQSFMENHGMAIKALAWTGEEAPKELSEDGTINIAGYSWNPVTDRMKVTTPKIFHGEKKKGRFTPDTVFFEGDITMENINDFYDDKIIKVIDILQCCIAFEEYCIRGKSSFLLFSVEYFWSCYFH